jgi:origin recognition complex subunit 2
MDAGILKNPEYQSYLSELSEIKYITLIISVDHIKAGMLWSEQMLDRFGFIGVEINTYEDFEYELEYQSPLFSFKNDNQEVGLAFVLKSMTRNQREIIKLIAQHQLNHPQDKGISLKDLLELCVEHMLAFS